MNFICIGQKFGTTTAQNKIYLYHFWLVLFLFVLWPILYIYDIPVAIMRDDKSNRKCCDITYGEFDARRLWSGHACARATKRWYTCDLGINGKLSQFTSNSDDFFYCLKSKDPLAFHWYLPHLSSSFLSASYHLIVG